MMSAFSPHARSATISKQRGHMERRERPSAMERCRTSLNYLLGRARKRGRVSYWEYRVSHSPKEEEHALLADAFSRAPWSWPLR